MQICECCNFFDSCDLPKRRKGNLSAPCSYFQRLEGFPQPQYKALKRRIRTLLQKVVVARQPPTIIDVDVPLEIGSGGITALKALLDFLNVDLSDVEQCDLFLSQHINLPAESLKQCIPPFPQQMQKAQRQLLAFAEGDGDLKAMNEYLGCAVVQLYSDKEGLKTMTLFKGRIPGPMDSGFAALVPFFATLAELLLRRQSLKRCPVCKRFFPLPHRGPKGLTCGKSSCKQQLSRHQGKFLRK